MVQELREMSGLQGAGYEVSATPQQTISMLCEYLCVSYPQSSQIFAVLPVASASF